MNWQLPLMLAQDSPNDIKQRVMDTTLEGTRVPETSLIREGTSNPFVAEYWFPEQASSFAGEVDYLFMGIFWISLVFFVAIVGVMIYFCIKYRRKDGVIAPEPSSSHNTAIEILWSVLPSILLVWMFYVGADSYFKMRIPKDNAEEIKVTAKQFNWLFTYPNGDTTNELHLVKDKPVVLRMQSEDVLHSFYVAAFRQKQDIVPGRYTYSYIEPTVTGLYRLSCNEYCGNGHSLMRTTCEVHEDEQDRLEKTVWKKAEKTPWKNGEHLYQIHCSGCHSNKGQAGTGPALNLTWGRTADFAGGGNLKVDANYVRESIMEPSAKIVEGYGAAGSISKMNSFSNLLNDDDIDHIIEYLKYLQDPSSVSDKSVAELEAEAGATSD